MATIIKTILEEIRFRRTSIAIGSLVVISTIFLSVAISYHMAIVGIRSSSEFHQGTIDETHNFINKTIELVEARLKANISVCQAEIRFTKNSVKVMDTSVKQEAGKIRALTSKLEYNKAEEESERASLQETLTEHLNTNVNAANKRIDELEQLVNTKMLEIQGEDNATADELSRIKGQLSNEKENIKKMEMVMKSNKNDIQDIQEVMMNDREAVRNITDMYKKLVLTANILSSGNLTIDADITEAIAELNDTMILIEDSRTKEALDKSTRMIQNILNKQVDNQNQSIDTVREAVKKLHEGLRSFMYKSLGYVNITNAGLYHVWNLNTRSFENAKDDCSALLGFIVEFDNMEEENALLSYMSRKYDDAFSFWIGAKDESTESEFVWETSQERLSFTNWYDGEPNNAGNGEDCVEVSNFRKWNDLPCNEKRMFVCEFDTKFDLDMAL